MEWANRIVAEPEICGGRPHVRGTRLSVEFLMGLKAAGWSEPQILENYPQLTAEDLQALFSFAQSLIAEDQFLPLPKVA